MTNYLQVAGDETWHIEKPGSYNPHGHTRETLCGYPHQDTYYPGFVPAVMTAGKEPEPLCPQCDSERVGLDSNQERRAIAKYRGTHPSQARGRHPVKNYVRPLVQAIVSQLALDGMTLEDLDDVVYLARRQYEYQKTVAGLFESRREGETLDLPEGPF